MTLYMAVTADEYELPLLVEEDLSEFAEKLGKKKRTVIDEFTRIKSGKGNYNGGYCGYRMVKVDVEEFDEDRLQQKKLFLEACKKWKAGEVSVKAAAKMCGMTYPTFFRHAKKQENI